eukprot:362159-Chlamydomonas_euryale.AAC.6
MPASMHAHMHAPVSASPRPTTPLPNSLKDLRHQPRRCALAVPAVLAVLSTARQPPSLLRLPLRRRRRSPPGQPAGREHRRRGLSVAEPSGRPPTGPPAGRQLTQSCRAARAQRSAAAAASRGAHDAPPRRATLRTGKGGPGGSRRLWCRVLVRSPLQQLRPRALAMWHPTQRELRAAGVQHEPVWRGPDGCATARWAARAGGA